MKLCDTVSLKDEYKIGRCDRLNVIIDDIFKFKVCKKYDMIVGDGANELSYLDESIFKREVNIVKKNILVVV